MMNTRLLAYGLIVLCVISGVVFVEALRMWQYRTTYVLEEDEILIPEGIEVPPGGFDAITTHYEIDINVLRVLTGLGGGLLAGLLLARLVDPTFLRRTGYTKNRQRKKADWGNRLLAIGFVVLAMLFWVVSIIVWEAQIDVTNELKERIVFRYSGCLSVTLAWLIVGRRVRLPCALSRWVRRFLLGPFNWIPVSTLSTRQQISLWLCLVALAFLLVCPPRQAYWVASGGVGLGNSDFAGFHLLGTSDYAILQTAPYIVVEIDHGLQLVLMICVVGATSLYLLIESLRERWKRRHVAVTESATGG